MLWKVLRASIRTRLPTGFGGGVRYTGRRCRRSGGEEEEEENAEEEVSFEGSPAQLDAPLLHSDVDHGDGQVTYVLNGEGAPSIFTIDANTGDIHATKRLDREAQAYYTLRAQARDRATGRPVEPESQFVVKVQDINDNEPRFLDGPYAATVPEMSPMGGAKDMVGQMGGLSGTTSVTVTLSDVNDNPPHFYRKSYQFLVPESSPVSAVVARVKAVDSDLGSNADALDYETQSGYTLTVEVTNRFVDARFVALGPFSDRATVRLLVKNVDEPPVFSSDLAKMVVSEAVAVGTSIGRVSALDPDSTDSPVRYSIDRNTDLERYFNIDGTTGVIRTARPLDRELVSLHNITVTASESHNTASLVTRRAGYLRRDRRLHRLPVLISDGGSPALSGTATLSVRVCACHADGRHRSPCGEEEEESSSSLSLLLQATGLSPAACLSLLACLLILLGLALLAVTIRRWRGNTFILDDDRDVRENIVRYDDEGGGEEDTEAFDMAALRHLNATQGGGGKGSGRYDIAPELSCRYREMQHKTAMPAMMPTPMPTAMTMSQVPPPPLPPENAIFREFIGSRLAEADRDSAVPPYDSLQTYAFEGSGSAAESLSSLWSLSAESEGHAPDFPAEWGADFGTLADLCGHAGDGCGPRKTDPLVPRVVGGEPREAEPTDPLGQ
ncbi:hypothetical protein CRUP_025960 [Coryphaenoides rupestris]|nr:hypothetical protein CRUP_025960 [Coryphaenoides rupestris]